ncbi:MAG TPA: hypothetical protein VGK10_01875 [Prolixibacteraceae bacterium]|jgi:hypothetical protein
MKRLIMLLVSMSMTFYANSQSKIEVETLEKKMSQGPQTAFSVLIPDAKAQDIENRWKKYVNNRTFNDRVKNLSTQVGNIFKSKEKKTSRDRLKMVKTGDELHVRSIELDKISLYPMDIYAITTQLPDGCQLNAFFQYTDSVFIDPSNTDEKRLELIEAFVHDFGVEAYKEVVDQNIKLANRDVTREESNLKELNANTQRAEKLISRDEALIQQYNARISELRNDSVNMIDNIASKKKEISEMQEDSVDYQKSKAELKSLEREKTKFPMEISSLKGKIKYKELEIESAKNQIAKNELEIKNQEAVIQEKQQTAEELIKEKGEIQ